MGIGDSLRVDPERLSHLGNQMVDAATGLPSAPAAFVEAGSGPLSDAIRGKLPEIEDPIQEALPKLKAEATKTANNIVTAAGHYQRTDEQLAANYDQHRFDAVAPSGSSGSGGAGSDSMGQLSQLMSMPMQMASQAAQLPMKAMGAAASLPQSVMQGVQQFSQMGGGAGTSGAGSSGSDVAAQDLKDDNAPDGQDEKDEKDRQRGAAPGDPDGERAPVVAPNEAAAQQNSERRTTRDPSIDL